eukprot:2925577-Rhodomonas_salina.1
MSGTEIAYGGSADERAHEMMRESRYAPTTLLYCLRSADIGLIPMCDLAVSALYGCCILLRRGMLIRYAPRHSYKSGAQHTSLQQYHDA